jgi:hypothetical protein
LLGAGDGEAGSPDGVQRRPVAVAADDEAVEPVHPGLQARYPGVGGAHVLEEHVEHIYAKIGASSRLPRPCSPSGTACCPRRQLP